MANHFCAVMFSYSNVLMLVIWTMSLQQNAQ